MSCDQKAFSHGWLNQGHLSGFQVDLIRCPVQVCGHQCVNRCASICTWLAQMLARSGKLFCFASLEWVTPNVSMAFYQTNQTNVGFGLNTRYSHSGDIGSILWAVRDLFRRFCERDIIQEVAVLNNRVCLQSLLQCLNQCFFPCWGLWHYLISRVNFLCSPNLGSFPMYLAIVEKADVIGSRSGH